MPDHPTVLVVPPIAGGRLDDSDLLKWLSRGDTSVAPREDDILTRVLRELGVDAPASGLAALRFLGDTGERAEGFVCAADPIHYQARMRDLVVQRFAYDQITDDEVSALMSTLQSTLGNAGDTGFVAAGRHGYLIPSAPLASSGVSPRSAAGTVADRFMPSGPAAGEYHQLDSEIQMVLHDHAVNAARDGRGEARISALWFWGGGSLPVIEQQNLPPFYGTHSLLKGYWMQQDANVSDRNTAGLAACTNGATGSVVDLTALAGQELATHLRDAKRLMTRGGMRRLSVVSQDGLSIRLRRRHHWRFWKSGPSLLEAKNANE